MSNPGIRPHALSDATVTAERISYGGSRAATMVSIDETRELAAAFLLLVHMCGGIEKVESGLREAGVIQTQTEEGPQS